MATRQQTLEAYHKTLKHNQDVVRRLMQAGTSEARQYPHLHQWVTTHGATYGRKWVDLLGYMIDHKETQSIRGGAPFHHVAFNYLPLVYGGSTPTWYKLITMLAVLDLLTIDKPGLPYTGKIRRNTPAQSKSIVLYLRMKEARETAGVYRKVHPQNHYTVPAYTPEAMAHAESMRSRYIEGGGTSGNQCKATIIKIFGQEVADKAFDDKRVISKKTVKTDAMMEGVLSNLLTSKDVVTVDEVVSGISQEAGLSVNVARKRFNGIKPLLMVKYQLTFKRIGKRKQEALGVVSDKAFVTVIEKDSKTQNITPEK